MEEKLYKMEIGDWVNFKNCSVLKVPGGWVFYREVTGIFVPEIIRAEKKVKATHSSKDCPTCIANK